MYIQTVGVINYVNLKLFDATLQFSKLNSMKSVKCEYLIVVPGKQKNREKTIEGKKLKKKKTVCTRA